mmetsp:Transcript_5806/g.19190  ORF Transcript_5806/g.19190 Transcript_5806/m.19190 type:complete len:336 (-) Transcript_5806:574-1581(-)
MDMKKSAKTREMMAMSFIRMFKAGPLVSFRGSPTVSPITAALWHSPPLRWRVGTNTGVPSMLRTTSPVTSSILGISITRPPFSTNFFALSQAPPVFEAEIASCTPDTRPPARSPTTASTPKNTPVKIGAVITRMAGGTISRRLASVEILMHRSWSGGACPGVPSNKPGMVSNWRFTSLTISIAATPTDFMVMALNQYGNMLPINRNAKTTGFSMFTPLSSTAVRVTNAAVRARETSAALPMAKPLPIAAVVFPAASRASVFSRTPAGSSAISAIPPALSQMGPYTSIARQVDNVPSIPSAARATPYMSINENATNTMPARIVTGMMVDLYPSARP